jgi:hypothetical protein
MIREPLDPVSLPEQIRASAAKTVRYRLHVEQYEDAVAHSLDLMLDECVEAVNRHYARVDKLLPGGIDTRPQLTSKVRDEIVAIQSTYAPLRDQRRIEANRDPRPVADHASDTSRRQGSGDRS